MSIESTTIRIRRLMQERNLKQVDVLRMAKPYCERLNMKLTKTDLSQYISGKTTPGQAKLLILSLVFDVSVVWLMGHDVPMENSLSIALQELTPNEKKMLSLFRELNDEGKEAALAMLTGFATQPIYKKHSSPSLDKKQA